MRKLVFKKEFAVMGDGAALSLVQQQENVTTNTPGHEGNMAVMPCYCRCFNREGWLFMRVVGKGRLPFQPWLDFKIHMNLKSDPGAYGAGRLGGCLVALGSKLHKTASLFGWKYWVF